MPPLCPPYMPRFRNSHKRNICIEMLRRGYHRSFREVFALIQKQAASGEAPGPRSGIWQPGPLEEQPRKLEQIQRFLTRAEEAQRAGKPGILGKFDGAWSTRSSHLRICCIFCNEFIKVPAC